MSASKGLTAQPMRRRSVLKAGALGAGATVLGSDIRNDGAGFDNLDVPDGSNQPKLHFTIFVPTAQFFQELRINQASLDLVAEFDVDSGDNGLERFLTATRRQNFLVPPRRHRAFPLVEFNG
jgi:hypothetical protein